MANDSIRKIRAAYVAGNSDDKWFTDFASQPAIRSLENSLRDAKVDLSSGNFRATTIPSILAACDSLGNLASGKHLFKPGCERGENLLAIDPPRGDVLPSIYALQGQISALKPQFEAFASYDLMADIKRDWKNALLASFIWAAMAAVFAVSTLFYRRQLLWEGLTLKKLPDFVPDNLLDRMATPTAFRPRQTFPARSPALSIFPGATGGPHERAGGAAGGAQAPERGLVGFSGRIVARLAQSIGRFWLDFSSFCALIER